MSYISDALSLTTHRGIGLLRSATRRLKLSVAPSPALDADIAFLRVAGRFDANWYLQRYPDVAEAGIDPVEHYVRCGSAEGRLPCEGFDALRYTQEHPEVTPDGINPYRHYLEHGAAAARAELPVSKGDLQRITDAEVVAQSAVFDREGYLAAYPSVANAGVDPVLHYLKYGAKEGRNPCSLFDTRYYLKTYPDVAKAQVNPLVHFCRAGFKELRNPHPDFDTAWYVIIHLAGNPDGINPLAHYLNEGRREGLSTRAATPMLPAEHQQLRDACDAIVEAAIVDAATCLRLAHALEKRKSIALAEKLCRCALSKQWNDAETHARLAALLSRQRKWWQAADTWQEAIKGDEARSEWWFKLGEAHEEMHRFDVAAVALSRAVAIKPKNEKWWYRLGYAAEKAGQLKLASTAYAEAIKLDPGSGAGRFGVGVFHQARGYWPDATIAYEKRLRELPLDAELHYRLGMAHDRCYRWDAALASYRRALSLNPLGKAYWHYRCGFVLERMGCWNEAAQAYAGAIRLSEKPIAYWHYRRAYVLAEAGQHAAACLGHIAQRKDAFVDGRPYPHAAPRAVGSQEAAAQEVTEPEDGETSNEAAFQAYMAELDVEPLIREVVAADTTDASIRYRLGGVLENKEDWAGAARAYADALDRSAIYQPKWFYRLGFALFQAGQFEEACRAFRQTYIIQRAAGIDSTALAKAHPAEVLPATYVEYMENLPIRDDVIVYESHIGKQVSCNPLAIFKYLVNHPDYQSLLHVWVVNDPARVPDDLRKYPNVVFAPRPSDLYLRYLATAKYLVNNTVFPQYFVRRDGQKFLATWHGTPLKTLGKQQQYKFQDHKRAQRNFLQATHIISPNPHTTGVLFDSYDIRHTMGGKLAETGYPRIDLTLNASEARRAEIRAQLGVDGKRPVVLYAPTWRGTLETVSYEVDKAKADLQLLATRHDCDIVFRGHHLMEKVFDADEAMGCIVAPATLDTNELLSAVDVLITDYSSIFFDFLPTGRPVLYYTYDLEEYSRERGMYFSMDEMPGYKCHDVEALSQALDKALGGQLADAQHRTVAQSRFNAHDDGRATERVVDFFFNDAATCVVDPGSGAGKRLLMHGGGFQPNGITTSFLNLTKHIDRSRLHITVPISSGAMEFDRTARSLFERLPEDVAVVSRHGPVPMTWEERWLRTKYETARYEFNDEQMAVIKGIFAREYRRIFGTAQFDTVITFSGYDAFWASVLNLGADVARKVIYLHSDIRDEYVARFPELMRMLRLYRHADVLACVCEQSRIANTEKLAGWLDIPPEKFISSENVQDPERILALADEEIEEADAGLFGAGPVFINMGRMSVEKDQAKLIRAFARLAAEDEQPTLLLLGDGPLRGELEALVEQLGMAERIHVLGFRTNPYPYLRRSDCFVLSSNHEAKTMSLIESLILGLPFVATDISGNADVKHMFPTYFVDNSEQGLLDGMRDFLNGALPKPSFDWHLHQVNALGQFYSRVVGMEADEAPSGDGL